jgi:alpha-tubulin suppressor-like RCC1 family protein
MAAVACPRKFATVVTERGQLYSWGSHKKLQLGPEPSRIDMNPGKRFVMVAWVRHIFFGFVVFFWVRHIFLGSSYFLGSFENKYFIK